MSSPYIFGALWNPLARDRVKSIAGRKIVAATFVAPFSKTRAALWECPSPGFIRWERLGTAMLSTLKVWVRRSWLIMDGVNSLGSVLETFSGSSGLGEPIAVVEADADGLDITVDWLEMVESGVETSEVLEAALSFSALSRALFWTVDLKPVMISTGISAMPTIKLLRVPRRAEAAPLIGSHGPSSESYSHGRYLYCQYVALVIDCVLTV